MNNTYIQELLKLAAEKKGQKGKNQGFPNPSKSQKAPMNSKMQGLMDTATGGSEDQRLAQALSQTPAAKAAASNSGQPSAPVKSIPAPPPAPPTQTYPVVSRADRASAAPATSSQVDTSKFNTSKGGLFRKFRDQMKFKQTLKDRANQESQWANQSAQQAVKDAMPNANSAHGANLTPQTAQVGSMPSQAPIDTNNLPRTSAPVPAQAAPTQAAPVNYGKPMAAPASVPVATPTPQSIDTSNMSRSAPAPGYSKPMEAAPSVTSSAPSHVPVDTSKFNLARAPKQSMGIMGRIGQWLGSDAAKAGGTVLAAGAAAAGAKKKAANQASAAAAANSAQPHAPVVTEPHTSPKGLGRNKVLAGLGMLGTLGAGYGAGRMMSKEAAMSKLLEHGYDIDTALKLIDHTENH